MEDKNQVACPDKANTPTTESATPEFTKETQWIDAPAGIMHKKLVNDILNKAAGAICGSAEYIEKAAIVLASLEDQQPKDAHEARLCAQAVALYSQGLKYMQYSDQQTMFSQCEFYIKNAVKLLRLHNETVEAINRYRRGGEQRVIVQHVNVNDGGQAVIVGSKGEGGNEKIGGPHGV